MDGKSHIVFVRMIFISNSFMGMFGRNVFKHLFMRQWIPVFIVTEKPHSGSSVMFVPSDVNIITPCQQDIVIIVDNREVFVCIIEIIVFTFSGVREFLFPFSFSVFRRRTTATT